MVGSKRILVNTIAQAVRSILNILLLFYATRVILRTLGVEDFGIYSVIAGIISLLAFVTNALVITTQRYLSVVQGKKDIEKSKNVFCNSLFIHIVIGLFAFIFLEVVGDYTITEFLNISSERIEAAYILFQFIALIIVLTLITSPFRAIIVAHENIVYVSVIETLDSIFKLLAAFLIAYTPVDRLISYGIFLLCIQIFNFITLSLYAFHAYEECIFIKKDRISKKEIKDQLGFAGWTVYNIGCVYGRMQGIAFIINKSLGAVINASYGLAFQVSSGLQAVSQALLNAMNPQLMRAEGEGNRERMFRFAEIQSKFTFFILASLAIPIIFEMPRLLEIWLGNVPQYAVLFSRMVVLASLCDMITVGLGSANQACGSIKTYTVIIYTTKVLTLPFAFIVLHLHLDMWYLALTYVGFEAISALLRITVSKRQIGLNIAGFIQKVILKEFVPIAVLLLMCIITTNYIEHPYRFIFTFTVPNIVFIISLILFGLCPDEKLLLMNIFNKIARKK